MDTSFPTVSLAVSTIFCVFCRLIDVDMSPLNDEKRGGGTA